jgi:hypothetical protein
MTDPIHDLQPGQDVSIEALTILRKLQFEQAAREHADEAEAEEDQDAESRAEAPAAVRKAKQPAVRGGARTSTVSEG